MPRGFGISSYMTQVFGRGHQSPEWEAWSVARKDPIKVLRLANKVEADEKKNKKWASPGQIIKFAKEQGLEISNKEAVEFAQLHKERFDRKAVKPWRTKYYLTIPITPKEKGLVDPPGGVFDADAEVILTATPVGGYEFDRWTGDYSGKDNPATIVMDSDKKITAHFKKV